MNFINFMSESSVVSFHFKYDGRSYEFSGNTKKQIFIKVIDWLSSMGYSFTNVGRQRYYPNILDQIPLGHRTSHYHKIPSSNKYVDINFIKKFESLISLLKDFGVENNSIEFNIGSDSEKLNNELVDFTDEDSQDLKDPNKYNFRLKRFKASQSQEERPMEDIKKFKAIQAQEEREDFFNYSKNSFSQAICVLGESGSGKSTTIDNILDKSNNNYQYIIPSASTTGLLSQYSPSSGYIPSRLGNMIESAYKNPKSLYTAVFDECHKTNIIEMINDELLQAISKNRNRGVRFISLDEDTKNLYPSAKFDRRGNILIPDNLGFIFISSNARVISGNPDFFNRVDLVEITESDRNIKTIDELNSRRLVNNEDKKELVNKILGKYNDL